MSGNITLPGNCKPSHYRLSLRDLDFQSWTYKGTVSIDLQVTQTTKTIALNAEELKIIKSELHHGNGDVVQVIQSAGYSYQNNDTVTIAFNQDLDVGKAFKLVLEYEGMMNDQSMGFYRAQYRALSEPPASVPRSKTGSPYMVCTQFEAVGARRAFPCFDEPNMKASFALDIVIPEDQTAISNTPVAKTEDVGQGCKRVTFEETPVMSSYLLAWAVGDLKYIETTTAREYRGKKIPVRFYAAAGAEQQGMFAAEQAAKAIDFFSEIFEIEYPLAKMDLLAVPEFAFGAMENWGLITGKTNLFLFDEKTSTASKKEIIASVAFHEVAHQWFGNLVTMDWWDELWLNEGFATWAAFHALAHFYPEWNTWESFMSDDMEGALTRDSMRSSHPIHVEVPDARNAHEVFDQISYKKSCSVLNMVANHMGVETFLSGVSSYLKKNMHRNATAEDLWQSLGEASGDDIVNNIKPWIQKIGHPVLIVTRENGQVTLRQSRFLAVDDMKPEEDETIWWIPLGFQGLSDSKAPSVITELSERQKPVTLPEELIYLLNNSGTGFYRVEYPQGHLAKVSQKLSELNAVQKLTILNSTSALAFSGSGSVVSLLEFTQAFAQETSPQVWFRMMSDFTRLLRRFSEDKDVLPKIKRLTLAVISKAREQLGWEKVDGESHLRSNLRRMLLDISLDCDCHETEKAAIEKNALYMATPDKLPVEPSLLYIIWGAAARASPKELVPEYLNRWQESASNETKVRLVRAMGRVSDKDVIRDVILPFCFGTMPEDRVLRPTEMTPLISTLAYNSAARPVQWEYIKSHWDAITAKLGTSDAVSRILSTCLPAFTDAAAIEDIERFFVDKDTNGYAATLATAKDVILNSSRFRGRERASLASWLDEQGYMAVQTTRE